MKLLLALVFIILVLPIFTSASTGLYISEGESKLIGVDGINYLFTLDFVRDKLAGMTIDDGRTIVYTMDKRQNIVNEDNDFLSITLKRIDLTNTGKKAYFDIYVIKKPSVFVTPINRNIDLQPDTPAKVLHFDLGETKYISTGSYDYEIFFEHADQNYAIFQFRDKVDNEGFRGIFNELEPRRYVFNKDVLWFRPLEIKPTQFGYEMNLWIDSADYEIDIHETENPIIQDTGVRYVDEVRVAQILSQQADEETKLKLIDEISSDENFNQDSVYAVEDTGNVDFDIEQYREKDEVQVVEKKPSSLSSITGAAIGECSGCLFGGTCYATASRTNYKGKKIYCGLDNAMRDQHSDGALCESDFECYSNVCSSGYCSSGLGFWERFFAFFRK